MPRPSSRHPTELEWEILKIVWSDGAVSGRHVCDALNRTRELAYTSVLTVMNIMVKKGYLTRFKPKGTYLYKASIAERVAVGGLLKDLVARAFDGSASDAMLHLLQDADMDADELKRVRRLINEKVREQS